VLQRSWTVEQEHAANDAGAVYVGRASFRMGGTPTQTSDAVGGGVVGAGGDEDFFAAEVPFESSGLSELPVVPRVPTERIVLAPGSPLPATSPHPAGAVREAAAARKSILVSFGGAFLVGVVCTMAGQVALHWRARHLGAESVAEAPAPTPVIAPPVAEPSARPAEPAAAASSAPPAVVVAPAAAVEVVPTPVEPSAARGEDLGVSEARTHSRAARRQVVSAPVAMDSRKGSVKEAGGKEADSNEADSKEVDGKETSSKKTSSTEASSKEAGGRETGTTRRTAAEAAKKSGRAVWIDPFADDGEAPAGNATDRGVSGAGAEQPVGRGVDSVGSLTFPASASRSPSASRPTSAPRSASALRAQTTRGPRWVDPFAE
jgi:hypothetical protein